MFKPKTAQRGDNNQIVKGYQAFLKDWKLYRLKLDGDFGKGTLAAVEKFQKKNRPRIDGKINKMTAAKVVDRAVEDEYRPGRIQKIC